MRKNVENERVNKSTPRLYKVAASIFQKANEGESLNNLIYNAKHHNLKAIYAMVCIALRNNSLLDHILSETNFLEESGINVNLGKILISELLWGKKRLGGDSKPIQSTRDYQLKFEAAEKSSDISACTGKVIKPRYAKVNTILTSMKATIQRMIDDDFELLDTKTNYKEYLETVCNLSENQFVKDFHFDDLLVFSPKSNIHGYQLVKNGNIILQDKSSCLPPRLLNPPPGSVVLDMCAAPGIKTIHLAGLMQNKGTLYAVDNNPKRFKILDGNMSQFCGRHNCVTTMQEDSLHLTEEKCPKVKYIMIDPSCSGMGMTKRIEDGDKPSNRPERFEKLALFQERILVQALTEFPDVERVVYSTCSTAVEENEEVVEKVLARVPEFLIAEPCIKNWERRGNADYSFGSKCLVANMEDDKCNGFFVAVFERVCSKIRSKEMTQDPEDEWQQMKNKKQRKRKSTKGNDSKEEEEDEMATVKRRVLRAPKKK